MFPRGQKYFFFAFLILISPPLIAGLVAPEAATIAERENRPLSAVPEWPSSFKKLSEFTRQLEAYLADRLGLRAEMIRAYANLNGRILRSGNDRVLVGIDGRMFYRGDDMIRQSAGIVRRDKDVVETVDFLVEAHELLKKRDVKFIVAFPPNSSTIYSNKIPHWARNKGRFTEYDLLVGALRD